MGPRGRPARPRPRAGRLGQFAATTPQAPQLHLEIARELCERLLPAADERELALDVRDRLFDDPQALLVARILLPAPAQCGTRLLRLGELDELLEDQPEQVAEPDQLLQVGDVGLGIRPVGALLAIAGAEQAELFVVADGARRDADALRNLADAERAHAATSMSSGSTAR